MRGNGTLTERQQEVLQFIRDYTADNGRPPSYRDISQEFAFKSPNGAKCHVDRLARNGAIRVLPGMRGIVVNDGSGNGLVPTPRIDGEVIVFGNRRFTWQQAATLARQLNNLWPMIENQAREPAPAKENQECPQQ